MTSSLFLSHSRGHRRLGIAMGLLQPCAHQRRLSDFSDAGGGGGGGTPPFLCMAALSLTIVRPEKQRGNRWLLKLEFMLDAAVVFGLEVT